MKLKYKIPFAWLLGLLLCGSLSFQANAQQLDNLLAMNVEPTGVETTDTVQANKEKPFGCTYYLRVKQPDGSWRQFCTHGQDPPKLRILCGRINQDRVWAISFSGQSTLSYSPKLPEIEFQNPTTKAWYRSPLAGFDCNQNPFFCNEYEFQRDGQQFAWSCSSCNNATKTILKGGQIAVTLGGAAIGSAIGGPKGGVLGAGAGLAASETLNLCEDFTLRTTRTLLDKKIVAVRTFIAPNPVGAAANSILNLHLPTDDEVTIEVFNSNGQHQQTVMMGNRLSLGDHKIPLATSNLAPGLYIVKITSAESGIKLTQRLVKK